MKKKYLVGLLIFFSILIMFIVFSSRENVVRLFKKTSKVHYKKPGYNVILISIDSLRPDHLQWYGYDRDTSPNIDGIAEESVVFEKAISQSAWTLPTHASIMTGLLPSEHGFIFFDEESFKNKQSVGKLDKNLITLAKILKYNGYRTIGYTGGGWTSGEFGLNIGFDTYQWGGRYFRDIFEKTIRQLKDKKKEKFFLFLHAFDVHSPYNASKEYNTFYDYTGSYKKSEIKPGITTDISSPEYQFIVSQYDAGIRRADFSLGVFVEWLKQENLYNNTILIITSDHGEGLISPHNSWGHIYPLHEEFIHVPMIIRIPGLEKTIFSKQIPASISILPTVLDILDIKADKVRYGNSLMNFFSKKNFGFDYIISETGILKGKHLARAIRTDKWKLILYQHENKKSSFKLFNLEDDPKEQINIADKNPDVVKDLAAKLPSLEDMDTYKLERHTIDKKTLEQLKTLGYIK
ncbi:MAG TPA: hypothetical protein ENI07_09520 [Desulfobacterales bacterium]|nr:hypothetical protein [Desulfobacterales bacterium]